MKTSTDYLRDLLAIYDMAREPNEWFIEQIRQHVDAEPTDALQGVATQGVGTSATEHPKEAVGPSWLPTKEEIDDAYADYGKTLPHPQL